MILNYLNRELSYTTNYYLFTTINFNVCNSSTYLMNTLDQTNSMSFFKKSITLFLLFLSVNLFAQTTPIPDGNFEQFLVDAGIDTNGVNGNILDVDAEGVTNLNISRNDILDVSGLEAFVNLITLNLGQNQLPTIPLNTLTLLEELNFARNTALTSLDLSQNLELRELVFNNDLGPPLLTTLDLSNNTKLENLNVRTVRSITSLTLPVTSTLTDIYVANLSVPTIDLSQLTGDFNFRIVGSDVFVTIIYPNKRDALKNLELSSINFTTVDISEMIGLERFGLSSTNTEEIILPSTSTLTRVNISGHELAPTTSFASVPELTYLNITNKRDAVPLEIDISQNLELTNLSLSRNNMVNLDISQNTKLTNLDVNTNNFTSIDVSQNLLLEDLNVSSNQLPVLDVQVNTELTRLEANNNLLPSINLTQNTLLRYLYLGFNQLPNLDITQNSALWILAINNNLFTGSGLDLSQNVELFSMNISNNQVETLDFSNTVMRNLNISYNIFPGNQVLNDFYAKIETRGTLSDVVFRANNNLLTGAIPDFYAIYTNNDPSTTQHRRWWFNIENNYFHFGDFENQHVNLVSLLSTQSIGPSADVVMKDYTYAPQAKVNTIESLAANAGDDLILTTTVRGSQNHYKWFKDGIEIPDAPDAPNLILNDIDTCDDGVYYAEITSDLVPFENANAPGTNGKNLLLVRNDITLTVNATKECVTLANPINGATEVPINTGIEWNDNAGACGYKITVTNVDTGNPIQYGGNPITNLDVGDVTLFNFDADLPNNTVISVRITPYFEDGDFGGCITESFTTNATTIATECTTLNYPRNNDVNVPDDLSSISWNPANAADSYKLTITSTSGTNDIPETNVGNVLTYPFTQEFQEGDVVTVSITPTNSLGDATCSSETFTIQSTGPQSPMCTTLISPANNATNIALDTSLEWNEIANADGYKLTVTANSSTANNVTELDITSGNTYDFSNNFEEGETVTVTIAPYGVGGQTNCLSESFTIKSRPICTNLTSPLNGANDVAVDTNLEWDAVANANGYIITVDGSISNENNVSELDITLGNSYDFKDDFEPGETVTVTITPYNEIGEAIGCTSENFTIKPLPLCTILSEPLNNDTNVAVNTSIEWNAVANADGYLVTVIGSNSTANNMTDFEITSGTSFDFINDFIQGETVTVTIKPYNDNGEAMGCSSESFTIIPPPVPSCTTLVSPLNNAANVDIDTNINWNTVANATGYKLTVTASESTVNNLNEVDVIATSYDFTNDFIQGETVTVTIKPFNSTGEAVGCSTETFTIKPVPDCTNLSTPVNGDNQVETNTSISWNAVSDAIGYFVNVEASTSTVNNFTDRKIIGTSLDFDDDFTQGETVAVTITPYNESGSTIGCTTETFTIVDIPPCTNLISPANGDLDVAINTGLEWAVVPEAAGYILSVNATKSNTNNSTELDITNGNTYNFTDNFEQGEIVTVLIKPYNNAGEALGCTTESFTIKSVPSCTTLVSPRDNDVRAEVSEITWNEIADADGYRLTITSSNGTANNVTDLEVFDTTYTFSNEFNMGETVTVTIIPFNEVGNAEGCFSENFTIRPLPTCTGLIASLQNAEDVAVTTDIEWEPATDADGYRISVGTTMNGTDIVNNEDVASLTSYILSENLPSETTIYVSVVPYNSSGIAENCNSDSFTTETIAPDCVILISPANGETNVPLESTITWDEVEKTDGYRLSIGTSPEANDILDTFDMGMATSYTHEEEFPFDTEIYVTITSYNSAGDAIDCELQSFTTLIPEDDTKYGFSPDGDGINEYWHIENIDIYPINTVSIYNRWGDMVFKIENYDNATNVFSGNANMKTQLGADRLPAGTYFFNIQIEGETILRKTQGFLVLKR